ncbi:transmembrane 220 family protein [Flavihumibacter sp. CACIAM 22H1]|uniref:transmembrane 220 family protein n=1 Tax=Flavihumibacter sp. CACIAM 22H1 TaxID=1812911 RepID=UPI0007A84031|nr:transmembrane 220 family protein [Flavihumibacter sp. CACIAM 22H1]KYP15550.1 MAG: hypothetical protein A1D16_21550 [Flavihumibacter sp. CACIAM 22H1]
MKWFNYIFMVLFILSAALQYNDPDPYIWIPLYLLGAWICWMAIQKKFPPLVYLLSTIIYVGYALFLVLAPEGVLSWIRDHEAESLVQSMKATKPWIEQSREFGGLMILLLAVGVNWWTRGIVRRPS